MLNYRYETAIATATGNCMWLIRIINIDESGKIETFDTDKVWNSLDTAIEEITNGLNRLGYVAQWDRTDRMNIHCTTDDGMLVQIVPVSVGD